MGDSYSRRRKDNHEFGVVRLRELPMALSRCDCPEKVYEYWMANIASAPWYNPDVECLCAIHLNTRRRPTGFQLIGIGTLDCVLMSPREVFRSAILRSASAIAVAHNHPSGDPTPSDADVRSTRELMRAGHLLRIEVVDHVVIGQPEPGRPRAWASLRELGQLG
jgi:DNA repair protein RadC